MPRTSSFSVRDILALPGDNHASSGGIGGASDAKDPSVTTLPKPNPSSDAHAQARAQAGGGDGGGGGEGGGRQRGNGMHFPPEAYFGQGKK